MRNFGKVAVPVVAVVASLIVGASPLWAIPVPEIEPSSGITALALIAGAAVVIRSWRKK